MPPNLMPRRERPAHNSTLAEDLPPEGLFELSGIERSSHVWLRLKTELTKRLQQQREINDGQLDPEETARVRGHIDCLKGLIALGEDPPTLEE